MKCRLAPLVSVGLSVGIGMSSCSILNSNNILFSQSPSPSTTSSDPSEPSDRSDPSESLSDLTDFPHQYIDLTDNVEPESEFNRFRRSLRDAIGDRDADFVARRIPTDGISIGFSRPIAADELGLSDPDAFFWQILYKSVSQGCDRTTEAEYPSVNSDSELWVCPNITKAFYQQYPPPDGAQGISYEMSQVIVVGDRVTVYAEPDSESIVVGLLSDEVVTFNQSVWEQMPDEMKLHYATSLDGWTPIILPNGTQGYISNRNAYRPLDARLVFGKVNGQWMIVRVPSGD
ncbi:MAG: hypothetical protein ACFE0I_09895 [Elainellaceae cyanobacterium]